MGKLSKIDWDIIEARVRQTCGRYSFKTLSVGLLSIVLEQFFPGIEDQLHETITDGADDRGIDAVYIIEGELQAEVFRSEEHTSEVQSLMRISYAVFCLKK